MLLSIPFQQNNVNYNNTEYRTVIDLSKIHRIHGLNVLYYITYNIMKWGVCMESLLLVNNIPVPVVETVLNQTGYKLFTLQLESDVRDWEPIVTAMIVHASPDQLRAWFKRRKGRLAPVFWWPTSAEDTEIAEPIDGLLYSGIPAPQIKAMLTLGRTLHLQRRELREERDDLLEKLHERKWIEQAKAILSEIQGLSESEAYHFLRKEAMKERKKMMDIAQSIVKAYQLIKRS